MTEAGRRQSRAPADYVVVVSAVLCLAGYIFVYATGRADRPIRSDGYTYYVYLPSWFIFHDTTLSSIAQDCCGGEFPAFSVIIRWPGTRRWVNPHPIGVAVMQAPFFLVAHALTKWTNLSPDGFTLYYQHGAGLAGLAWTIAGLWILRNFLRRHFSDGVTAAAVIVTLLGTNLYHYATFDSSYSHAYSFCLFAAFLDLTDRWYASPTRLVSFLLGLTSGLIVLTRHTNVLFLVCFPLYGLTRGLIADRIRLFRDQRRLLTMAIVTAILVVVPQLALYYRATGHLLISAYGDLGFNFPPQLFGVLFSVQKGVFFWSPVLLLAVAGLVIGRSAARPLQVPATVFLIANTLVIASWWDWQFGGSYGHRGFVDAMPIFAVGLASFFEWSTERPRVRTIVTIATSAAVALCVFQMLQYWNGTLPMSDTTWEQYRALFRRL